MTDSRESIRVLDLKIDKDLRGIAFGSLSKRYNQLKLSIIRYGYKKEYPVLVGFDGMIIDGHARYEICKELGIEPSISKMVFHEIFHDDATKGVVKLEALLYIAKIRLTEISEWPVRLYIMGSVFNSLRKEFQELTNIELTSEQVANIWNSDNSEEALADLVAQTWVEPHKKELGKGNLINIEQYEVEE